MTNNNKQPNCNDCNDNTCMIHSRTMIDLSEMHALIMKLRGAFNIDDVDAACNELHQMSEFTVADDKDNKPKLNTFMIAELAKIQQMVHGLDCAFHNAYECR